MAPPIPSQYERQSPEPSESLSNKLHNDQPRVQGADNAIPASGLQGREMRDMLAEKSFAPSGLYTTVDLDECNKIAISQFDLYVSQICEVKEPEYFLVKVREEIKTRRNLGNEDDYRTNCSQNIAAMIHNSYLLASGWKIVSHELNALRNIVGDHFVPIDTQLAEDDSKELRTRYLILCDIVNVLTLVTQNKLALLATSSSHFRKYFSRIDGETDEPQYLFNCQQLEAVGNSLLDYLIIELCLPNSQLPMCFVTRLLGEAMAEATETEKATVSQALWDAVGNLSICVDLQEYFKASSKTSEVQHGRLKWKISQSGVFPPRTIWGSAAPDDMWYYLNENSKAFTGRDLNSLWNLEEEVDHSNPQWHSAGILDSDKNTFRRTFRTVSDSSGICEDSNSSEKTCFTYNQHKGNSSIDYELFRDAMIYSFASHDAVTANSDGCLVEISEAFTGRSFSGYLALGTTKRSKPLQHFPYSKPPSPRSKTATRMLRLGRSLRSAVSYVVRIGRNSSS
ncbi:hypothetical protein QCA50_011533 [Cerrena zonata]|uniref:Uncharacterized protein n=1 Tax=Cerrena zonata TaxID=2478898 RepID=A0AAW0FVC3_9APHY